MRRLRASELGSFLYCQRAWWYQKEGIPSQNQAELSGGKVFHHSHARQYWLANFYKIQAIHFVVLALIILFLKVLA